MTLTLPIYQLDAFAEAPFTGNPAAVVPLDGWPDDAVMQAIAAENNLAETAFFAPTPDDPDSDYRIRWFTPTVEASLCGHATPVSYTHLMVMTEEEKTLTAYHEAGHALVGIHVPGNDPLHKVTIIPRGRALGVTMNLPERDRLGYKKMEMQAKLAMMYGGRAAEDIIFGPENVTTGASNDIQQATNMARAMVTEYGMSEKLGRLRYNENQDEVFLGHSVARQQNISEKTAQIIDEEIRRITEEAETVCYNVLREHEDELHTIAKALLDYETLSGDEVHKLLRGEAIHREERCV